MKIKISHRLFSQATSRKCNLAWRLTRPNEIVQACQVELGKLGVRICYKRHDSAFSSYRLGTLWLSKSMISAMPEHRAKVFEHELVHVRQDKAQRLWTLGYMLRPGKLWVAEIQSFGQGIRCMVRMGMPDATITNEIQRVPDTLWDHYRTVRVFDRAHFRELTLGALRWHAQDERRRLRLD